GETSVLESFLSERRGGHGVGGVPGRGGEGRLPERGQGDAERALGYAPVVGRPKGGRRGEALAELRGAPNLHSLPTRIECFDISTIQGQETVGSMVVFEDGVARKAHYRKFAVRGVDGPDDFAAMREVISRRFSRLAADPASDDWNESFAATPNLVVIDG